MVAPQADDVDVIVNSEGATDELNQTPEQQ